jgi:hypothetical protein
MGQIIKFITSILFVSLMTITNSYAVNDTIRQSHYAVMNQEFPNKKAVFLKFGTPTNSSSFENVESWYYKIGEETNNVSRTLNFTTGTTHQNYLNPWLIDIFKSIEKTEHGISNQTSNSKTLETYVKFWFMNDTVVKWETYGVDYSRNIVRPSVPSAGEYLFFDSENRLLIHSHISKLRQLNSGINGPMNFLELNNWLDNHPDFNKAFLPTIDDLKKLYYSSSKLRNSLSDEGLIVWSETLTGDDKVLCLNFKTGALTMCDKNSRNYFVPLVAVPAL